MADVGVQKTPGELPESRCMEQRPHCWGRRTIFVFWGRSSRSWTTNCLRQGWKGCPNEFLLPKLSVLPIHTQMMERVRWEGRQGTSTRPGGSKRVLPWHAARSGFFPAVCDFACLPSGKALRSRWWLLLICYLALSRLCNPFLLLQPLFRGL